MTNLFTWLRRLKDSWQADWDDAACRERARDPLSHPALQRMTLEELADLPFDRRCPAAASAPSLDRPVDAP
jgi:hypothetical protein